MTKDTTPTKILRPSEEAPKGSGAEESARMVVIQGKASGLQVSLDRPETTIGRLTNNHLVLDSATVSRQHARVLKDGNRYEIEDLKSRNGIAINGERLNSGEQRPLVHGDTLRLGDQQLVFLNPSGFGDQKGISTIVFDRDKVTAEVDALFKRLPKLAKKVSPK